MKLFEVYDTRFNALIRPDSKLKRIVWGCIWAEGAVYFADDDALVWSDIPNNRMLRWTPADGLSTYRQPANFSNGNTRDRQGRLVTCEHGTRRVTRTEADGTITVLADNYQGKRLNSPNDVVVKSDGTVWFTDPTYGIMNANEGYFGLSEVGGNFVYRLDPATGDLSIAADDLQMPNGLAFSPDESVLYVADSGAAPDPNGNHHLRAYDVADGKRLTHSRIFAVISPGVPDGFRLDANGYLYITAHDGVQVYSAAGELLGKIFVPEIAANCTFGGRDKNILFIAATSSIYTIPLNTTGIQTP